MKSRHDEIRKKYGKGGWNIHIRWVWSGADAVLGAATASLVRPPHWAAGRAPCGPGRANPRMSWKMKPGRVFLSPDFLVLLTPGGGCDQALCGSRPVPTFGGHGVCVVAAGLPRLAASGARCSHT